LPTPTRDGHTFTGWFTAATGGTEVTTNYVFSANATIFARWTLTTSSPELTPANPLRVWVRNGMLHVTGLTAGKTVSVYSASGALVHQNVATSNETDIPLSVQGVYIVRAGEWTVRVSFN
jgi:uncharacterized repeat protein (TIGR02543 family)